MSTVSHCVDTDNIKKFIQTVHTSINSFLNINNENVKIYTISKKDLDINFQYTCHFYTVYQAMLHRSQLKVAPNV